MQSPVTFGEVIILRRVRREYHRGIWIFDPNIKTRREFNYEIKGALDFMALNDAVRFQRILRHVKYIGNLPSAPGFDYTLPLQICTVDMQRLAPPSIVKDSSPLYCCLLVVASAIALLKHRGIVRKKSNADLIAELLSKEVSGFARKANLVIDASEIKRMFIERSWKEMWWRLKIDARRINEWEC